MLFSMQVLQEQVCSTGTDDNRSRDDERMHAREQA